MGPLWQTAVLVQLNKSVYLWPFVYIGKIFVPETDNLVKAWLFFRLVFDVLRHYRAVWSSLGQSVTFRGLLWTRLGTVLKSLVVGWSWFQYTVYPRPGLQSGDTSAFLLYSGMRFEDGGYQQFDCGLYAISIPRKGTHLCRHTYVTPTHCTHTGKLLKTGCKCCEPWLNEKK